MDTIADAPERHASWIEHFFDLAFVAAVAALTGQLHDDHSVRGLAEFAGLFVPVWWAWRGFTWYATSFGTQGSLVRLAILAGMLAVAVLSAGVRGAAHGDSEMFVVAYSGLLFLLTALYAREWVRQPEVRPLAIRYVIGDFVGATMWLGSLALDEEVRPFLWAAAMLVLIAAPLAVALGPYQRRDVGHIAERYGLFTMIVLGESIAATVAGLGIALSQAAVVVALLGFVLAASVWWVYFDRWRTMPEASAVGRFLWAQGHFLVFAGIAAAAVGVEFAVDAAAGRHGYQLADSLPLGSGVASYLVAMAMIRAVTRSADRVVVARLIVALAALVTVLLARDAGPLGVIGIVTGLLLAEAIVEGAMEHAASASEGTLLDAAASSPLR